MQERQSDRESKSESAQSAQSAQSFRQPHAPASPPDPASTPEHSLASTLFPEARTEPGALARQGPEPTTEEVIDRAAENILTDLASMRHAVVNVFRDALNESEDIEVRLKAAVAVSDRLGATKKRADHDVAPAQVIVQITPETAERMARVIDRPVVVQDAEIVR